MSTIFVSHSSADNALAEALAERLRQNGHQSIFLDFDTERGIVAGRSWERTLYRKLRACEVVIALCTDSYLASQWCFAEIALARMESKQIIAVKADRLSADAQLPSILTERQFIDLRIDSDDAYRRLFRGLAELDPLGAAADWDPRQSPYLGLDAYHEKHAAIFFGREPEIRQGIQLLDRGAPGLIMILGASGSGKSSLARAGIVPRLRRTPDNWLIVDPFRPGHDPFGGLADALAHSFRVAFQGEPTEATGRDAIRHTLRAWQPPVPPGPQEPTSASDLDARTERLDRLLSELEALEEQARQDADTSLTAFLNWSVEDLRRICGRPPDAEDPAPGDTPLTDLARRLRHVADRPDARLLIVVDQFEELLGAGPEDHDSRRLLALLAASMASDPGLISVLGTMRSDFLETFQRANAHLGMDFEAMSLGPIPVEGIRRVIEAPAKLGAIELEAGLADRLIADADDADALPLLSFTLWRMWQDGHENGVLTLDAYEKLGGLNGAVAGEADALLRTARQRGQEPALRAAFQTMVRLADDGQFARKPVPWDSEALQPVHDILSNFVERRLLTVRADDGVRMVEIAHEALFRTWAPLRQWVDEQRAELVLRHQLTQASGIWAQDGRKPDDLWRGARLAQAVALFEDDRLSGDDPESRTARAFVKAAEARRRKQARRRRNIVAGTTGVLVLFLAYAIRNEDIAKRQQREAAAQQWSLAAIRDLPVDPLKSLGLAQDAVCLMQAFDGAIPDSAYNALNRAVQAVKHQRSLRNHSVGVTDLGFAPAPSQTLMSLDGNGIRMGWDVAGTDTTDCAPVPAPEVGEAPVRAMAIDPGGRFVALASAGTVRLHDLGAAGDATAPVTVTALPSDVTDLRLAPDGRRLAATDLDGRLHIATLSSDGRPGTVKELAPIGGRLGDLVFTDDGSTLIAGTWSGAILVRDASSGAVSRRLDGHTEAVTALAAHDRYLASGGWGGTVRIWDIQTGDLLHALDHDAVISELGFADRGAAAPLLVSASWDGSVAIWDPDTGEMKHRLSHEAPVTALAIAPGGSIDDGTLHLATGDWDGNARLWSVAAEADSAEAARLVARHTEPVTALAFSPDAGQLASGSDDTAIHVTRLSDSTRALDWASSLDLERSDDGQTWFAVIVNDGVRVLDAASGRQQRLVTGYDGTARAIAFDDAGGDKLVIDADRRFDFYLNAGELMYCADSLSGNPVAALPPPQYNLADRCTPADFSATYQSLVTRVRLFFADLL